MVIKAHCCLMFVAGCDSYMNLVGLEVLLLFPPVVLRYLHYSLALFLFIATL